MKTTIRWMTAAVAALVASATWAQGPGGPGGRPPRGVRPGGEGDVEAPRPERPSATDVAALLITQGDADGNGQLNLEELAKALEWLRENRPAPNRPPRGPEGADRPPREGVPPGVEGGRPQRPDRDGQGGEGRRFAPPPGAGMEGGDRPPREGGPQGGEGRRNPPPFVRGGEQAGIPSVDAASRHMVERFDENGDGALSAEELAKALVQRPPRAPGAPQPGGPQDSSPQGGPGRGGFRPGPGFGPPPEQP